jgi:Tfp pilus assembly protein PilZ
MERVAAGDRAEFRALVDELADLEARRGGPDGASADDAARLEQVERRLIQLITTEIPQDERRRHVRLPCDLRVSLRAGGEAGVGVVVDVGTGGIFVETTLAARSGDAIDVEIHPADGDEPLRVRGKVAWATTSRRTGKLGLGIAFVADDAGEHRLRLVIVSLLRKRLAG